MDTPVQNIMRLTLILTLISSTAGAIQSFKNDQHSFNYDTSDPTQPLKNLSLQFKDGTGGQGESHWKEILFKTLSEDPVTLYFDAKKVHFSYKQGASGDKPAMTYQGYAAMDTSTDWHTVSLRFEDYGAVLEVDGAMYYSYFHGRPTLGDKLQLSDPQEIFTGCMDNFTLNGVNIQDSSAFDVLEDGCSYSANVVSFPNADSFLNMSIDPELAEDLSIRFQFRTFNFPTDLLELVPDPGAAIKISIKNDAAIEVTAGGNTYEFTHPTFVKLADGSYHDMLFHIILNSTVVIEIDGEELVTPDDMTSFTNTYAASVIVHLKIGSDTAPGIKGCMKNIKVENSNSNQIMKELSDFTSNGAVIGECEFTDWCVHEPCAHDGNCEQTEASTSYKCDCKQNGYEGSDCLRPQKPSNIDVCLGENVTVAEIDPDGAGPLGFLTVDCVEGNNDKWTVIPTLSSENVVVSVGSSKKNIKYREATLEQLSSVISRSKVCKQSISLTCENFRLMSIKDGTNEPYVYWQGGFPAKDRYYWGGSDAENLYKCAEGNTCNCDNDNTGTVTDEGDLTTKEDLPVSMIVFNETEEQGTTKSATYTVGSLMCKDDAFLADTSAVTFITGETPLMINVDEGDAAVDISFMFKTKQSHAYLIHSEVVEMDNQEDFYFAIGIASSQEIFVTIKSKDVNLDAFPVQPLGARTFNNDEWHTVYFEMTHTDAFIRIDYGTTQIWKTDEFLPYPKLYPTRKLYVGGSPNNMMGHIGCIKNLRVHGKLIDLHSYVKAEGVKPGCVGQCDSNPCLNAGTCVEHYNTFTCDCSNTGYSGCYCGKDTSITLQDSIVTYDISVQDNTDKVFQVGFSTDKNNSSFLSLTGQSQLEVQFSIDGNGAFETSFTDDVKQQSVTIDTPVHDNKPHTITLWETGSAGNRVLTVQLDEINKTLSEAGPDFDPTLATFGTEDGSTEGSCIFTMEVSNIKQDILKPGTYPDSECAPSLIPTGLKTHKQELMKYTEDSKIKSPARKPPSINHFGVVNMPRDGMESKVFLVEPITLKCEVEGVPPPRVIWKKDGSVLQSDCYHLMTSDSLTVIPTASGNTAGMYECRAENPWGISQSLKTVELKKPPLVTLTLTTQSEPVTEGEGAIFNCTPANDPNAKALWFRENKQAEYKATLLLWPGAGDVYQRIYVNREGQLGFRYCLPEDNDYIYKCSRINPATGESHKASEVTLDVTAVTTDFRDKEPEIAYYTLPVVVDEGSDLTLECIITDFKQTRTATAMWYHEGNEIKMGTNSMYGEVLQLRNLTTDKAGTYTCKISGTEIMQNTTVDVIANNKPKWKTTPDRLVKYDGNNAEFKCELDTQEDYTVEWFSNWNPLTISDKYELGNSNKSLTVKNVSKDTDLQTIGCKATVGDTTLTAEGFLNVINELKVVSGPKDVILYDKEKRIVEFAVMVTADPVAELKFTWFKDNVTLSDFKPGNYKVSDILTYMDLESGNSLKLDSSKLAEGDLILFQGEYSCTVSDGVSQQRVTSYLSVRIAGDEGLSTGAVVGIVVGVIFGVTIIALIIGYFVYNRNKNNGKYGIEGTVGAYKNPAYTS